MKASARQKGKRARLGIALLFVAATAVVALVFSHYGGFGTGPSADAAEFVKYAQPVSEITELLRARTQTDYSVYLEKINAKYEELKNLCS